MSTTINADNLKLQEEIQALKKLGEHYENQLKLLNIEVCDLPDDVLVLLSKCADLQFVTHLQDLNLNYLREYYHTKKRESIDQKLIIGQQTSALEKLKRDVHETERNIKALESFTDSVKKRITSTDTQQRDTQALESKTQALLDRQKGFNIPENFNIESLIDKLDALERRKL